MEWMEIVSGFNFTLMRTEFGLALNLHPATNAIVAERFDNLAQLYRQLGKRWAEMTLSKLLKRKKFRTTHTKKIYELEQIGPNKVSTQTFDCRGQQETVFNYFRNTYPDVNIDRNLPVVRAGNDNFFPLEVCQLANPIDRYVPVDQLDSKAKDQVLSANRLKPLDYFDRIHQFACQITDYMQLCKVFPGKIERQPARLKGEIVDEPLI